MFLQKSFITLSVDGLEIELLITYVFCELLRFSLTNLSISDQLASLLLSIGPFNLCLSYKVKIDDSTLEVVPPLTFEYVFPSIFIGLPSLVLTTILQ